MTEEWPTRPAGHLFYAREKAELEERLTADGMETTGVDDTVCCYAAKTETWVTDPDGAKWEWYVKTGDAEQMANVVLGEDPAGRP